MWTDLLAYQSLQVQDVERGITGARQALHPVGYVEMAAPGGYPDFAAAVPREGVSERMGMRGSESRAALLSVTPWQGNAYVGAVPPGAGMVYPLVPVTDLSEQRKAAAGKSPNNQRPPAAKGWSSPAKLIRSWWQTRPRSVVQ